jgi:uncharacterized protein (DUF302 family)
LRLEFAWLGNWEGNEMQINMDVLAASHTCTIPERLHRALQLIRRALTRSGLSIVREFDAEQSRILLVDCPLLAFEAQALHRAAGVFLPLHVLVRCEGDVTLVTTVNPAALFDGKLPSGSAEPVERLYERVSISLLSIKFSEGH